MISIVVTFISLIIIRRLIINDLLKIDKDTLSPSDFCLIGNDLKFNSESLIDMESELRDHFDEKFGKNFKDNIVYINFAFKIGDFLNLIAKIKEL